MLRCIAAHGTHGTKTLDDIPPESVPAASAFPPKSTVPVPRPADVAPGMSSPVKSTAFPLQLSRTAASVSFPIGPALTMKFQNPRSNVSGRITYEYITCADDSAKSNTSPWSQWLPQKWNRPFFFWFAYPLCASRAMRYKPYARRLFFFKKIDPKPPTPPASSAKRFGLIPVRRDSWHRTA